jgi:hypothetical protein
MAEQVEVNDELKWDFGKRNRWLEENVLLSAQEELAGLHSEASRPKTDTKPAPVAAEQPEDDLPF